MSRLDEFLRRLPECRRRPFLRLVRAWVGDVERIDEVLDSGYDGVVESVVGLVERLKAEGLAPKTITSFYLPYLKKFLRFCGIKLDWDDVKLRVEIPGKRPIKIDRAPTLMELRKLILGAKSRRLKLLIWLMAVTGLRAGEALALKVENFDFTCDPPVVRVVSEKTWRRREIPLTREIAEELKEYLRDRRGYAFSTKGDRPLDYRNFLRDFKNLTLRLGINRRDPSGRGWMLHPHSLRKFYKTRLEEAGVNFLVIETWMGHDIGVSGAYFRPTRKMILEEWRKAEKALTLFSDEKDRLYEDRKIEELERDRGH